MAVSWAQNLVEFFPDGADEYSPDDDDISQSMDDLLGGNESIPDLATSDADLDPFNPEENEAGVSGILLKGAAFAGVSRLLASGILAKSFSGLGNRFDDTGDDDLLLDMSMDLGDDFTSSIRSMGAQAAQESSQNLLAAPIPTGVESTSTAA